MIAAGADIITIERAAPSLLQLMRDHAVRYIGSTERENDPLFLAAPAWNWKSLWRSAGAGSFRHLEAPQRFLWHPGRRSGPPPLGPVRAHGGPATAPRGGRSPAGAARPPSGGPSSTIEGNYVSRQAKTPTKRRCGAWTGMCEVWKGFPPAS
ncbi:MAG: hypothetical protein V8Q84_04145, partial [Bilophila sp.]